SVVRHRDRHHELFTDVVRSVGSRDDVHHGLVDREDGRTRSTVGAVARVSTENRQRVEQITCGQLTQQITGRQTFNEVTRRQLTPEVTGRQTTNQVTRRQLTQQVIRGQTAVPVGPVRTVRTIRTVGAGVGKDELE